MNIDSVKLPCSKTSFEDNECESILSFSLWNLALTISQGIPFLSWQLKKELQKALVQPTMKLLINYIPYPLNKFLQVSIYNCLNYASIDFWNPDAHKRSQN